MCARLSNRAPDRGLLRSGVAARAFNCRLNEQQLRKEDPLSVAVHDVERLLQLFLRADEIAVNEKRLGGISQRLAAACDHP